MRPGTKSVNLNLPKREADAQLNSFGHPVVQGFGNFSSKVLKIGEGGSIKIIGGGQ